MWKKGHVSCHVLIRGGNMGQHLGCSPPLGLWKLTEAVFCGPSPVLTCVTWYLRFYSYGDFFPHILLSSQTCARRLGLRYSTLSWFALSSSPKWGLPAWVDCFHSIIWLYSADNWRQGAALRTNISKWLRFVFCIDLPVQSRAKSTGLSKISVLPPLELVTLCAFCKEAELWFPLLCEREWHLPEICCEDCLRQKST